MTSTTNESTDVKIHCQSNNCWWEGSWNWCQCKNHNLRFLGWLGTTSIREKVARLVRTRTNRRFWAWLHWPWLVLDLYDIDYRLYPTIFLIGISCCSFIIRKDKFTLGNLERIRLEHDNKLLNPDWKPSKVIITSGSRYAPEFISFLLSPVIYHYFLVSGYFRAVNGSAKRKATDLKKCSTSSPTKTNPYQSKRRKRRVCSASEANFHTSLHFVINFCNFSITPMASILLEKNKDNFRRKFQLYSAFTIFQLKQRIVVGNDFTHGE